MKTFLRLTLCCLAMLGLHGAGHAQKTVPAYIVNASADTIQGQLLNESINKRTFRIQFDSGAGMEAHDVKTIVAYGIGDSLRFEAKDVYISEATNRAFLQVIVDGPTKLYYSRDLNVDGQYYIQKPGEPTIQLRKNIYKSILNGLFADCSEMKIEQGAGLNNASAYNAKGLAKLVTEYNNCTSPGAENQVFAYERKVKVKIGVMAGMHQGNAIGYTNLKDFTLSNIKGGPGASFGVHLNFEFSNNGSIQPELLYTTRRLEGTVTFTHPDEPDFIENFIVNAHYLQMPVLVKYSFGHGKLKPYVAGGPSISVLLRHGSKARRIYETGDVFDLETGISKKLIGFAAATGMQYTLNNKSRLLLELRYTREVASSNFIDQVQFKNLGLMTGITF